MSRILLISEDDALVDDLSLAFEALGHGVSSVGNVAGLASGGLNAVDVVVVDTAASCAAGRRVVSLATAGGRPRVLWTGAGASTALGLVFDELPDAVLPVPVSTATAGAALARADRRRAPGAAAMLDLAELDLSAVDGALEYFPLPRVLWAAHRTRASGRLELFLDDAECVLHLANGGIVGGRGLVDALRQHGVDAPADTGLSDVIGAAIGAGARPDVVLDNVALAIGRMAAQTVGKTGGMVFFEPQADPCERPVPLPCPIPRLLASGLREVRPPGMLRDLFAPLEYDRLCLRQAGLGPAGLPPVALRLWRAGADGARVADLVGDDDQALLSLDLLLQLGLTALGLPPQPKAVPAAAAAVAAAAAAKRPRATDRAGGATRARPASLADGSPAHGSPAQPSPEQRAIETLRSERKRLRQLDVPGVLGITSSDDLEIDAVDARFRLLSARFHPDRYVRVGPQAQRVARDCFSIINDAYSVLRDEPTREDLRKRLLAREQGKVYSSDADKRKARLLSTQGEVAAKKGDWVRAGALLKLALDLNPSPWKTRFLSLQVRRRLGELSVEECAMELLELEAPAGRARSEVQYQLGELLLASDREQAAFKAFEEAVAEYPDHVEAKRRLRLRRLRQDGVDAVRASDAQERQRREESRARNVALAARRSASDADMVAADEPKKVGLFASLLGRKKG